MKTRAYLGAGLRGFAVSVLVLLVSAAKALGCGDVPDFSEGAMKTCEATEDCVTGAPYMPGTWCVKNQCVCFLEGYLSCCDDPRPGHCDLSCRPREECVWNEEVPIGVRPSDGGVEGGTGGSGDARSGSASGSGGGVGGAGGDAGGMGACQTTADCPWPPDSRCGFATCEDGVCGLVLKLGAAESQIRGDCVTVYCDGFGNAEVKEDTSDSYNDGKACTLDLCDGKTPKNELYPEGWTCPEIGAGVCHEGECVECIGNMTTCPGMSDECDAFYCVPMSCTINHKCGIGCAPCPPAQGPCDSDVDCQEGVCKGGTCSLPTCDDGVKNDGETGKDCGSAICDLCPDGEGCERPENCVSGVCWIGKCRAPACDDGVKNGGESGIDCGGSCAPCAP